MGSAPTLADAGGKPENPSKSWNRRGLAFRLAAGFAVFCLVIAALEILLGLLRVDRYDSEFTPRSSYPLFVPGVGPRADSYVTNEHFWRAINFQQFSRVKDKGVFRVFVLGGSAAHGWPVHDRESFTGYLRRALDQAAPGRFEIVNAAGVSYGTHRMLDLLTDVLRFDPDMVVIYEGNNEYVERNVLPSGERKGGPLFVARNLLSRSNIYRTLRLAIWKTPGVGGLLARSRTRAPDVTDPRTNPAVMRGNFIPTRTINAEVLANLRHNVSEMARLLDEKSVASVFCSVPVNLGDWPPSGIPPRFSGRDEAIRYTAIVQEALGLTEKDPKRAAALLEEVVRAKPDWAPGAFYMGKALEAAGDYKGALEMFRTARDRDASIVRAVGPFNEVFRSVGTSGRHSTFLDLEAIFRDKSPYGITGNLLMRDYCHPTEMGHKLIATSLLPILLRQAGMIEIRPVAEEAIRGDATAQMKDAKEKADELFAKGMTYSLSGRDDEAEKVFREVLRIYPDQQWAMTNLGTIALKQGRLAEAESFLRRARTLDPESVFANYNYGALQFKKGNLASAEEIMHSILRKNPAHPEVLMILADIAMKRGAFRDVLGFCEKIRALGYEDSYVHLRAGKAALGLGDKAAARVELSKTLEFDPTDEEAYRLLNSIH